MKIGSGRVSTKGQAKNGNSLEAYGQIYKRNAGIQDDIIKRR